MDPTELSLSPACRILVVSGDRTYNLELVRQITPLVSHPFTPNPNDGSYVEWTIKNKYYTAPVHLYLHEASKPPAKPLWPPETEDERVPALIFVFRKDESYRELFLSMREAYTAHNAEVAIAVALPPNNNTTSLSESFDSMEEFFSNHNFEYVDAEDSASQETQSEGPQYDVRGLPRILEALNMIMWPSMVRTPHGGLRRGAVAPELQDDSPTTTFEHSFAVSDTAPPDHSSLFDASPGSHSQSLAELNAWLDSDDSWAPRERSNPVVAPEEQSREPPVPGFEDDFTDFLSAPPEVNSDTALPSSADVHATAERIFGQNEDAPGGFDLTSILGTLETMRLEIGAIEDHEERRKAAARVALGLAMGLGLDERDEGDEELDEVLSELHQLR